MTVDINKVYIQDNLELMYDMDEESIDLIYLDPPYNSGFNYRYAHTKNNIAFNDTKLGETLDYESVYHHNSNLYSMILSFANNESTTSYLMYMTNRLIEMRRILKDSGSIYIHLDDNAVHYIKVIMDYIFGDANFINEIIWQRTKGGKGSASEPRKLGRNTDYILLYVKNRKGNKHTFHSVYMQLSKEAMDKKFSRIDENGKYFRTDKIIVNDGVKGGGCHYTYKGYTPERGWFVKREKLEQMDRENKLYWSSSGQPYRKYFKDEYKGQMLTNLWTDVNMVRGKEDTGYPTQKPLALLRRIILMSSNEGDVIFDPFVGSGTTIVAAQELGRHWIGCDINSDVESIIQNRQIK